MKIGVLALALSSAGFALAMGITGASPAKAAAPGSEATLELSVSASRALTVRNVSSAPVRIRSVLQVESVDAGAGTHKRLAVQNLLLRSTCVPKPETILVLAPGASLTALPWTGRHCASQCDESCRAEAEYPAGQYRYVVTGESGREWSSPLFTLLRR